MIRREHQRLFKNLDGLRAIDAAPDVMFVIDLKREHNAVAEARRLRIPLVAIVDTNADPDLVDYPIAGNDDAIRSIKILLQAVTEAIVQGKAEADASGGWSWCSRSCSAWRRGSHRWHPRSRR